MTDRSQPTAAHRDDGRERLGRLTAWIAAGGVAGVGFFTVVSATSAPAKTTPPDTTVLTPSNAVQDVGGEPATVPPTVPGYTNAPSATDPADGAAAATAPPAQLLQPPSRPPATSGHRHHQAAATTGGS